MNSDVVCTNCGTPMMLLDVTNFEIHYICPNCGHIIKKLLYDIYKNADNLNIYFE